jgi:hypothetical protein
MKIYLDLNKAVSQMPQRSKATPTEDQSTFEYQSTYRRQPMGVASGENYDYDREESGEEYDHGEANSINTAVDEKLKDRKKDEEPEEDTKKGYDHFAVMPTSDKMREFYEANEFERSITEALDDDDDDDDDEDDLEKAGEGSDGYIKRMLEKHGLEGVNKPKLTPGHGSKKGVVLAKEGNQVKLIRFGAKGYKHNYSAEGRKKFKTRHAKNIKRGKMSAAYWADKKLWAGPSGHKKTRGKRESAEEPRGS